MRTREMTPPAEQLTPPIADSLFVMFPLRQEEGYEEREKQALEFFANKGVKGKEELNKRAKKFEQAFCTKKATKRATAANNATAMEGWQCRNAPPIKPETMADATRDAAEEKTRNAASTAVHKQGKAQANAAAEATIKQGATMIAAQTAKSPAGQAKAMAMYNLMKAAAPTLVPSIVAEEALKLAQSSEKRQRDAAPRDGNNAKRARETVVETSSSDSDEDSSEEETTSAPKAASEDPDL